MITWILLAVAGAVIGLLVGQLLEKQVQSVLQALKSLTATALNTTMQHRQSTLTYYRYRQSADAQLADAVVADFLADRYGRTAHELGGKRFPVALLWSNTKRTVSPEAVLGALDTTQPKPLEESLLLDPTSYRKARAFVKRQLEVGPIKYEGVDYCMTTFEPPGSIAPPRVNGRLGLYYDCILTQYALEWELRSALTKHSVAFLSTKGSLPLRERTEATVDDPVCNATNRCAALAISTLVVFKRRNEGYYCLVHRRSQGVAVSPNTLHVVPAGMFERVYSNDNWSVELNIWRELLEELYGQKELEGTGEGRLQDYVRTVAPVALVRDLILQGAASLSVTGVCCDLLTLRPEVCTILVIHDPAFVEAEPMKLNWEYKNVNNVGDGLGAVGWAEIDDAIDDFVLRFPFSATATATLGLGREWIRNCCPEVEGGPVD